MVTRTRWWGIRHRVILAAVVFAFAVFAAAPAHAVPANSTYLNFNLNPVGTDGAVNYAGGSAPLVGSNIDVLGVKGLGTPSNVNSQLTITGGKLNFSTGNLSGVNPAKGEWDFGAGGRIDITGGIASLGIGPGSTLMQGSFSDQTTVRSLGATDLKTQGGAILNIVNPALAAYFGLPTGGTAYLGGLTTQFAAPGASPGQFQSTVFSGGAVATQPVPEPTTLAIFAAMIGVAVHGIRSRRAR